MASSKPSILLKCFVLFVTRVKLLVIAHEAIIKSKSSSKIPDFFKDALSIPKISAHSLLTEMISKAFSIALILDRYKDHHPFP